jgi:hypothetical protein
MTRAMRAVPSHPGPRYLRWALVKDARIVREAVWAPDRVLTVGGDVPSAEVSEPARLAYCEDG